MGSHYLHTLGKGDRLNVFLDRADGFHLQQDMTKPMIFVSAGTGLAPMRAFLWERLAMKRAGVALAETALFNGIRSKSREDIDRDEIGRFAAEGVLNHVHVATSRERPGTREYVQDLIRAQGALVWRLLEAVYVYVCGAQPVRDGSAPPSPTWWPSTGRCRASARKPTWMSWTRPHATAPTCGADPGSHMDALALVLTAAALIVRVRGQRPGAAPLQRDRARARVPDRGADLPVHLGHQHAHRPVRANPPRPRSTTISPSTRTPATSASSAAWPGAG